MVYFLLIYVFPVHVSATFISQKIYVIAPEAVIPPWFESIEVAGTNLQLNTTQYKLCG